MKIPWFVLSTIALVSFAFMNLLITYLTRKGLAVSLILLNVSLVLSFSFLIQTIIEGQLKFSSNTLIFLLAAGILSAIGNWAQFTAVRDAPNPGLAIAIAGLNAGFLAVLAVFFLKDKLTTLQILGLILGIASIFLITFGSVKHSDKNLTHPKQTFTK